MPGFRVLDVSPGTDGDRRVLVESVAHEGGVHLPGSSPNPAGIVEDRVHSRSLSSSPARRTNGSTRDMRHCLNHKQQRHFRHPTLGDSRVH